MWSNWRMRVHLLGGGRLSHARTLFAAVLASMLFVLTSCTANSDITSSDRVVVNWFVGLGTGSGRDQVAAQRDVVQHFNESQDRIELHVEFAANRVANTVLDKRITDGDPPDLIGPVGIGGAAAFHGQFLDLQPYIDSHGFDVSQYAPKQLDTLREPDGTLTAIPYGVYPAMIYFNRSLFAEAGLETPPQQFGAPYAGGEWNMDALTDLALSLTRDAAGHTAKDPDFNPQEIVQWGMDFQWITDPRSLGTFFKPGYLRAQDGSATIPPAWLAQWTWYHNLIWTQRAAPTADEQAGERLDRDNAFNSGNVAMSLSHLWYNASLRDGDGNPQEFFDVAVVPTYDGTATSNLHSDTFRILKSSEHPDETFTVMEYLLGSQTSELLQVYGAFPARQDLQDGFLAALDEEFPQGVHWSVAVASLDHSDVPNHEAWMPNHLDAENRLTEFGTMLRSDPAMDVAAEAERLRADLDTIFAVPG